MSNLRNESMNNIVQTLAVPANLVQNPPSLAFQVPALPETRFRVVGILSRCLPSYGLRPNFFHFTPLGGQNNLAANCGQNVPVSASVNFFPAVTHSDSIGAAGYIQACATSAPASAPTSAPASTTASASILVATSAATSAATIDDDEEDHRRAIRRLNGATGDIPGFLLGTNGQLPVLDLADLDREIPSIAPKKTEKIDAGTDPVEVPDSPIQDSSEASEPKIMLDSGCDPVEEFLMLENSSTIMIDAFCEPVKFSKVDLSTQADPDNDLNVQADPDDDLSTQADPDNDLNVQADPDDDLSTQADPDDDLRTQADPDDLFIPVNYQNFQIAPTVRKKVMEAERNFLHENLNLESQFSCKSHVEALPDLKMSKKLQTKKKIENRKELVEDQILPEFCTDPETIGFDNNLEVETDGIAVENSAKNDVAKNDAEASIDENQKFVSQMNLKKKLSFVSDEKLENESRGTFEVDSLHKTKNQLGKAKGKLLVFFYINFIC